MPEPGRLLLLEQLSTVQPGTKVRFLGCVHAYDTECAQMTLRSHYPATEADVAQASVSVEGVLENLDHDLLSVGAWLNVVGYVYAPPDDDDGASPRSVQVAAIMVWSAGAIRTDRYESAVREYQKPLSK